MEGKGRAGQRGRKKMLPGGGGIDQMYLNHTHDTFQELNKGIQD